MDAEKRPMSAEHRKIAMMMAAHIRDAVRGGKAVSLMASISTTDPGEPKHCILGYAGDHIAMSQNFLTVLLNEIKAHDRTEAVKLARRIRESADKILSQLAKQN